ncbi:tripartite tricarboxylate transporter substrate binding protein [Bradyrhizobium sp. LHD-71]|uniref:Bug family tripartite tricarboxylate transporter substrate binding protein n=1 Tax=Bradyrhizobium sp. LHD-71 TaxID=3072141 RepID=UPI00280DBE1D|nr:tripartite tricarboxylate transporter substrate binding protein [Bradyrhizobium sp. LHD-71]MDQ8729343.1 tripartite tricarboxylate transporter substrate binding protein [Bradyrhizobium sp. LHD-71]
MASAAWADQYPSRQVTIVVPYPAGVPFDLLARALAERIRPKLGAPVIVENRPGGNGIVATQSALQAKADGHTLLLGSSAFTSIPLLMDKPGYATTDFVAVAPLGMASYMLFVGGNVPAGDIPSLISYMKANAGKINMGVLAAGGTVQLLARRFAAVAGVELTEIRYRGSTDMAAAMVTGDIQMMFSAYNSARPFLESGKIKAVAVGTDDRSSLLPDLPTFKEKGFPTVTGSGWLALYVRAETPPEIVSKIKSAVAEVIKDPAYREALRAGGMDPWPMPLENLQAYIDEDTRAWDRDIKELKLKLQ